VKSKLGDPNTCYNQHYSSFHINEFKIKESDLKTDKARSRGESSDKDRPKFLGIWTFNIVTTLLAQAFFDFHMG